MGSSRQRRRNVRSRGRRPRAYTPGADDGPTGFEPPQHSMFTFEGRIEQMGNFARSVNRRRGWRRTLGKLVFVLPFLLGFITMAVYAVVLIVSSL